MRNKIFILCGVSGSGKSTFAKKLAPYYNSRIQRGQPFDLNPIILNADTYRGIIGEDDGDQSKNHIVFRDLENFCAYFMKQRRWIIIDNTNLSIKARKTWIKLAYKLDYDIICYVFKTDARTCVERDKSRNRTVGFEVINNQFEKFVYPTKEEGITEIYEIDGNQELIELIY